MATLASFYVENLDFTRGNRAPAVTPNRPHLPRIIVKLASSAEDNSSVHSLKLEGIAPFTRPNRRPNLQPTPRFTTSKSANVSGQSQVETHLLKLSIRTVESQPDFFETGCTTIRFAARAGLPRALQKSSKMKTTPPFTPARRGCRQGDDG